MTEIRLELKGPLDLKAVFRDITRAPFAYQEHIVEDKVELVVPIGPGWVWAKLQTLEKQREPGLIIQWQCLDGKCSSLEVESFFARYCNVNWDLPGAYRHLARIEQLRPALNKSWGLRWFRKATFFEALATAIIDQQLNVAFAVTLRQRFIENFGPRWEVNGRTFRCFPMAETVAELEVADLRRLQFSTRKAEYIIAVAHRQVAGDFVSERLERLSDDELRQKLLALRGVGPWTAEYTGLLGLGREDFLPAGDVGLQKAVQRAYGLAERPRAEEVYTLAQAWRPYRGIATIYLWRWLES